MAGKPRAISVLIVDDVEDNRELYAIYLEYLGFDVDTSADGATALSKALTHRPDVIVLDFMLPAWTAGRPAGGSAMTQGPRA